MTQNNTQHTQSAQVNATPTNGQLSEIDKLKLELAQAKAKITLMETASQASITYKCRAKGETYTDGAGKQQIGTGVLSMSGLGKFPVSLYKTQWDRLIVEVKSGRLEQALETFKDKLATKG